MATKVKGQRLNEGAAAENLGFNPDKRPIQGEGEPTSITPEYIGQQYVDTTENKMYFATGTEEGNREAVGAGGGDFDPDGTYPNLHAGLTDQIYTDENTISIGDWNFRTTAGDVSVPSSGQASLNHIMGKMIRTTNATPATFNFTCTTGITVTNFNKYRYISAAGNTSQTIVMTLSGGNWDYSLSSYGITVELATGTTDGTITIVQTAEDAGTLIPMKPKYLRATGVNQMGTPGRGRIDAATIQGGQIVSGENYVFFVRAYGGVTNGYMARNYYGQIVTLGRCQDRPDIGSQLTQNNIQGNEYQMWMPFEETGWFVVEGTSQLDEFSSIMSIHPRWSNQQEDNVDAYTYSDVSFPMYDINWNTLPVAAYGMPSLGDVADEMNLQTWKYTKRIERYVLDYGQLADFSDNGAVFDYDNNYAYVVKETPDVVDIRNESGNTYTANDYGTEWLLDENYALIAAPMDVSTSYGTNLVDKLRTGVATKDQLPQVIYQQQYNSLPETKNSDGVIRFIYTADKPDNFDGTVSSISSSVGVEVILQMAWGINPAYPFTDLSVTSDNTSILEIIGTPYISGDCLYCSVRFVSSGTCTGSVTINGITKQREWTVYLD